MSDLIAGAHPRALEGPMSVNVYESEAALVLLEVFPILSR